MEKMKRLIIVFLSAVVLFASCAKVENFSARNSKNTEIVFNTRTSVTTKAIVESTVMADNFGVYGYVVPGDYSANGGYLIKNGKYDKDGNALDGPYYWPKSDNNVGIDFIFTAYSQYATSPKWEQDTLKLAVPALTQALINDPDGFNDVLWAQTAYNHHQDGNVGAEHERVLLNFKHALSWIQFRGEVENANVKWVKVKQISFGEYRDSIPGVDAIPGVPAYDDTTDTWVNLKKNNSVVASATKLKGPGETTYTNAAALPDELVNEIKSYYTVDNGAAGDYDLHMGNTVWDSNVIKKLRRTDKAIPADYDLAVEMNGGDIMHFFNGWKYLQDNGYDIQPANSGGKPGVWDYVLIDAFVNGQAYTVVGLNCWDSNAKPQYTIVHHDEVPEVPGVDPVPASGSEGLYIDGLLCLPTKSTLTVTPLATYGTQKDTTLNYVRAQVDTIKTNDHIILGNALVIPQPVPQNVTIVFDICIANPGGDEVVFTDRKITRVINTNKDMVDVDYVASWIASNKYIYKFKFDGDVLDFTTSVTGWFTGSENEYHVWDYQD